MPTHQVGNQNSNVCCDSLRLAHSANFIIHTFVFISHKIFRRGCFVPPRLLRPGAPASLCPPLVTPLIGSVGIPAMLSDAESIWTACNFMLSALLMEWLSCHFIPSPEVGQSGQGKGHLLSSWGSLHSLTSNWHGIGRTGWCRNTVKTAFMKDKLTWYWMNWMVW